MNNSNLASVRIDHILTDHFHCFLMVQQIYHQVLFEPVTVLEVHPLKSVCECMFVRLTNVYVHKTLKYLNTTLSYD